MSATRLGTMAAVLALLLPASLGAADKQAKACNAAKTVATQPAGAFLENMIVDRDGTVIYTSYMDRTLRQVRPGGSATVLASLPAHPISIARRGGDFWVVAQGASFADGPAFMQSNQLLRLDRAGRVIDTVAAPEARFLNGLADLPGGDLLIADSAAGVVWRFSPNARTLSVWLRDRLLLPDAAKSAALPGANGIEVVAGRVLISNTSREILLSAPVDNSGVPGRLTTLARTGPIDDFHVERDGSIIAATHRTTVIRVSRAGQVSTVLSSGADGSTATAPVPGRRAVYVLTTGASFGNQAGTAKLLEVALSTPTRCR